MSTVTFDWLEFDRLVIEMNNLHDLIGVVTLDIAEEYERGANAVSAIQSLTQPHSPRFNRKARRDLTEHREKGG